MLTRRVIWFLLLRDLVCKSLHTVARSASPRLTPIRAQSLGSMPPRPRLGRSQYTVSHSRRGLREPLRAPVAERQDNPATLIRSH